MKRAKAPSLTPHIFDHPFVPLLITFIAFRLMALLLVRPGGYLTSLSDFTFYRLLASYASQGFYPAVHYWIEYQPIFPWISVGLYRLSLLLPNWGEPGFWFHLFLATFFLLAEIANLTLLYLIGQKLHGQEVALRIAWTYSLLFMPLLIMLGWFDLFGLTFLLLSLYLIVCQRGLAGGIVAGVGFLVKLLPIIVVPVAFWREPGWKRRIRLVIATLLTVVMVALPFYLLNPELFTLSWTINLKRSSWETVWALLEGFTGYGLAGGGNRFDPAQAGALQHPSTLPWGLISAGFALVYLYLWLMARDKIQEAGSKGQEAGSKGQEAGSKGQEAGSKGQEGHNPPASCLLPPASCLLPPASCLLPLSGLSLLPG